MSIGHQCFTVLPNCPNKGVTFYDMAPLLASAALRKRVTAELKTRTERFAPTLVLALETRGYWVGAWLADALGLPLLALRKTANALKTAPLDKLVVQEFNLEYKKGESIALPLGCIPPGARILIVDDVFATGGTVSAAALLAQRIQPDSTVVGVAVLLVLMGLIVETDRELVSRRVQMVATLDAIPRVALFGATVDRPTVVFDIAATIEDDKAGVPASIPHPDDKRAALMWHPSMADMARQLLDAMPDKLRASPIRWEAFPDGWPNVHFEHRDTLTGRDVVFLASFHDKALLMEQISLMIAVPRQVIKSLRVFIPYFGPATMERVAVEGDLATAETLAKMCTTCLPSTQGGPPILTFFDIHALCERFYFDDRATVVFESALSLIKRTIVAQRMTVVFPDEGAFKRFYPEFKGQCPVVVCSKVRGEGDARKVIIAQQFLDHAYGPGLDPFTQPAMIIDDLVQSGSTLAECAVALRAAYTFPSISAYVTHAIFPNAAHLRFATGSGRKTFDTFYVTNTNPAVAEKLARIGAPFHVLDITPILVDTLDRVLPNADFARPWLDRVVLCSNSALKRAALEAAISLRKCYHAALMIFNTTGTRKQPIGHMEIMQCVTERLRQCVASGYRVGPTHWVMAIESGIVRVGNDWQEVTCIAVIKREDDVLAPETTWVNGPVLTTPRFAALLPRVLEALGEVTLGELLHAEDPNVPADAWYNRQELITEGIVKLLEKNHM
jgi:adenine phosphoribosyltransferase